MAKTIFITGASRGFGKLWAEALLQRGDKVVATARNITALDDLVASYGDNILPIQLDVNDRDANFAAIRKAAAHFGGIDVLINNAGYGLFGAIEEMTEKDARNQMETNFFGLLWLSQAVLPVMREQGSGHIVQLSSVLGLISRPVLGLYAASKFAVEGLSESLAAEVKDFGIKVSIIEPTGFDTDWGGSSAAHTTPLPEYNDVKASYRAGIPPDFRGAAEGTISALLKLISRNIMLSHVDSMLKYSQRYYKRQFINRAELSGKTVSKFNEAMAGYFENGFNQGLPNVTNLASQLNLSPRYLSDLLKQETGKTAIELIHIYLINEAKNRLRADEQRVSEIAYQLGFEDLSYFSRLFKKETGITPNQFKKQILN